MVTNWDSTFIRDEKIMNRLECQKKGSWTWEIAEQGRKVNSWTDGTQQKQSNGIKNEKQQIVMENF